jgi:transmembrane sensor
VNSPDALSEATRWLIELETADRLEDIWEEFDDWFQASAAHRAAYERVRRDWLRLTGSPRPPVPKMQSRRKAHRAGSRYWICASAWIQHWGLALAALLALIITCGDELCQLGIGALGFVLGPFS